MRDAQAPITFYRKDYRVPNHRITHTDLEFTLEAEKTKVVSVLRFEPWANNTKGLPIELDGENLELDSVILNGKPLSASEYTQTETSLTIPDSIGSGTLQITVWINPKENTRLEGLYVSNGNFFTQCEAQGFRRITYFPDRPDVLSRFTVALIANKKSHPVTLSNGNLIEEKELSNGLHLSKWEDPFLKPAYLFALVGGQFVCQEEKFTKRNGQEALLQVWVEPGNLDKTDFAMQSLKKSIEWDNTRFNLDLDLDRFMIVATADFNMGAMENKGLNIFNTRFVFANPELATDVDFENVESVVGHEYFHNWTGNRVTCQDWFQLSLKEGLTVFRDQEFSADMMVEGLNEQQARSARAAKRIDDVRVLRSAQFPEDAGPMAHPIRPDSYQEINNFYTVTVYEKGAEVIRMQHTLLGETLFQRGMAIYFERHDGHAVTCEDFVSAMETALQEKHPEKNLKQFRNWYSQAGTPVVNATWVQNLDQKELTLTLTQHCPPTPGQPTKPAFHIPIKLGFVNSKGLDLTLKLKNNPTALSGGVLDFTESSQTFIFSDVSEQVVPSILRGFSAPVQVESQHSIDNLIFLAQHDSDPFNRWDAAQQVYTQAIFEILAAQGDVSGELTQAATQVFGDLLADPALSDGYLALTLQLPTEGTLFEQAENLVDPVALHFARATLREYLACEHTALLQAIYENRNKPEQAYVYNALAAGERALKNTVLGYLCTDGTGIELAQAQYNNANNMTDRISALTCLVHQSEQAGNALNDFFQRFSTEALAIDKWFMVQATCPASNVQVAPQLHIQNLLAHSAFTLKNPNRARSVLAAFAMQNPSVLHNHDGSGYALWVDMVIELNSINPQVAARMARALDRWTKLQPQQQIHAKTALGKILAQDNLSPDVKEIVSKALGSQ